MINILISDPYLDLVPSDKLEQAAMAALEQQTADLNQDLTIAIEDDDRLHALNKEFLHIDSPTDVLSFPAGEGEIDPETGVAYLGDIIISYPRALEQSATAGHPVMNEIQLLVVHGVLHLLGHDHADPDEQAEMWAAQREALLTLGIVKP